MQDWPSAMTGNPSRSFRTGPSPPSRATWPHVLDDFVSITGVSLEFAVGVNRSGQIVDCAARTTTICLLSPRIRRAGPVVPEKMKKPGRGRVFLSAPTERCRCWRQPCTGLGASDIHLRAAGPAFKTVVAAAGVSGRRPACTEQAVIPGGRSKLPRPQAAAVFLARPSWRSNLRGLDGRVGQRLEVGFGDVGGLLGGLLDAFHRVGGGGDGRLDQRGGGLGTGRGVLHGGVDGRGELGLGGSSLGFGDLGHFGVRGGGDVVQMAAVGGGLLGDVGLQQAGLQREQFLGILGAEGGDRGALHFAQRSLGDLQVQLDELLDAFERLVGQVEQRFEVGFLGGNDLFEAVSMGSELTGGFGVGKPGCIAPQVICCQCNIKPSIGRRRSNASDFAASQHRLGASLLQPLVLHPSPSE